MGKWIHRVINKDPIKMMGECLSCGRIRLRRNHKVLICSTSRRILAHPPDIHRRPFLKPHILGQCEKCGILNKDKRFFDVNHIDGDHDNNNIENLELLCPNCHRIESLYQWKNNRMTKWKRNYSIDKRLV